MAKIYRFRDWRPVIAPGVYLHDSAVVIGDVLIAAQCYIGPYVVLRGDMSRIYVGAGSNIQDHCVLHSYPDCDVVLEEDSHIGHSAVLHGCHIGKNAMVGMQSVVMDRAVIGENAMVGAMAFVKSGMEIPPGMMAFGSPARVIRELTAEERAEKILGTDAYKTLTRDGIAGNISPCEPLRDSEPQRPKITWDL